MYDELTKQDIAKMQAELDERNRLMPELIEEVKRTRVAKITGESGASDGTVRKQPQRKAIKIGRNDPCPCGSGLKWKKCTCTQFHPEQK